MSFSLDLQAFANKVKQRSDLIVTKIVLDVGTALVMKSPVGDGKYWKKKPPPGYVGGRFRANWQYGLDGIDATITEAVDKSGGATIKGIAAGIPSEASGHIHYITNSLPYAQRIETGWSYRQAPQGVVGLTVLEFEPIVAAAARAIQ